MTRFRNLAAVSLIAGAAALPAAGLRAEDPPAHSDKRLVYADFENSTDGRPVSSRGGKLNLWGYQENPTRLSIFKGHPEDNSRPQLVRTSKDDDNHAAAFEYELVIPNQWTGVTMEVQGHAGEPGALPADDVTGYKFMNVQAYVTGTQYMRVEVMSNGQGLNLHSGYPMTSFKLQEGFNTYKVRLSAFSQPAWVTETRIDPEEVLKRLTSVTFAVFCEEQCRPTKGLVIVDNIVFEK
jgi:hypothetical protein